MAIDVAYADIGKLMSRLGDGRSRAGTFNDGAAAGVAAAGNADPASRGCEGFDSRPQASQSNATQDSDTRLMDISTYRLWAIGTHGSKHPGKPATNRGSRDKF